MKWVIFLQIYTFVLKHRSGKSKKIVDMLSQRIMLLNTLSMEVVILEIMKELYAEDTNFMDA